MNIDALSTADLVGVLVGAVLTLMAFSYLFGDNPLFRISVSLFVGASAGLAGAVAIRNVIIPFVLMPLFRFGQNPGGLLLAVVPLLLALMLFAKLSARFSRVGNVAMAYLVGVGAAAAVGGALLGTLFPQVNAAMGVEVGDFQDKFMALIGLIVTTLTLVYFHFWARPVPNAENKRPAWIEWPARAGQFFIAITFGVLFAGVYSAALAALIGRLSFLVDFVLGITGVNF